MPHWPCTKWIGLHAVTADHCVHYQPTVISASRPQQRFLAAQDGGLSLLWGVSSLSTAYDFEQYGIEPIWFSDGIRWLSLVVSQLMGLRWTCWCTLTHWLHRLYLPSKLKWVWPQCQILLASISHRDESNTFLQPKLSDCGFFLGVSIFSLQMLFFKAYF